MTATKEQIKAEAVETPSPTGEMVVPQNQDVRTPSGVGTAMEHAELVARVKSFLEGVELSDGTKPEVASAKHDEASNTDILKFKAGMTTWWVTVYKQRPKA